MGDHIQYGQNLRVAALNIAQQERGAFAAQLRVIGRNSNLAWALGQCRPGAETGARNQAGKKAGTSSPTSSP
ncbi:hypothetical protein JANAI62_18050 [Jannaschia pagri]|uniref:Uncharacterized protein n=1 Tax=Jannaschia pagri TaxID=2829797 RepID=A0ABQ4NL85_9RHOB|nr:hypothetical protein JANAI62_18050 [Jannaschia sp. AI_62]